MSTLPSVFRRTVVIREEGAEYLLYDRKSDKLYILSARATRALERLAETRDLATAVRKSEGEDGLSASEMKDVLASANAAGLLHEELASAIGAVDLPASTRDVSRDIRFIGDLRVAAWAISAKTAILA